MYTHYIYIYKCTLYIYTRGMFNVFFPFASPRPRLERHTTPPPRRQRLPPPRPFSNCFSLGGSVACWDPNMWLIASIHHKDVSF